MKKIITLVVFMTTTNLFAQPKLVRVLESFNKVKSGGIPPFITFIDDYNNTLNIGGWIHDSVQIYNDNGQVVQRLYNIGNIVEKNSSGIWQIGPAAGTADGSTLIAHPPPIYGGQYLSQELIPHARILNTGTNNFDSLPGINFNSGYFDYAFEMGSNWVLFIGTKSGSFSIIDGENYNSAVLWNSVTNATQHTYCPLGEGIPHNLGAFDLGDTIITASTGIIDNYSRIYSLKKGTTSWVNVYPALSCHIALYTTVINRSLYEVIETTSSQYQLYKLDLNSGLWEKLVDFTMNQSVSQNPIKGIVGYRGKIIVAGEFNAANGTSVNGLISVDTATNAVANVADLPSVAPDISYCLGVYSIGDTTLYVPWYRGQYGLGSQTLYQLKDMTVSPPPNKPPTANAGSDQTITLPTNSVTLSGSGTDSDGTVVGYTWKEISGPTTYTITDPSAATTTVTGLVQGTYQFQLTVTDNDGATGKDTMQVTANAAPPPNKPPVANAGIDQTITLPTNSVTLTGSGTDPDGTIAGYMWSEISGSSVSMSNPTTPTISVTGLEAGVYQFQLTVTDNDGAVGRDTVVITVNAAPVDEEVRVYPNPATTTLTATNSSSLSIYNINGQHIQLPVAKGNIEGLLTISVANIPSGIYVVRINSSITKKIIVAH